MITNLRHLVYRIVTVIDTKDDNDKIERKNFQWEAEVTLIR